MTLKGVFSYQCDSCTNVPGLYCEFSNADMARRDAVAKGWKIGVIHHWSMQVQDLCPNCICSACGGTRAVPDYTVRNHYNEPTPRVCRGCA